MIFEIKDNDNNYLTNISLPDIPKVNSTIKLVLPTEKSVGKYRVTRLVYPVYRNGKMTKNNIQVFINTKGE